ncbi:MAG: NADP-dependent glyceraldehyde-3-phosphate dehydrogenase [Syntrophus sp. (in: bacteria)]|nr:NADP-dependent glyceraldehyde-3-phosphate dehydrogenase [Syntrophus sp. (in: bacteria)]
MIKKRTDSFFPETKDIPRQFALENPIMLKEYLIGGTLRTWEGLFREVFSPVCTRTASVLTPQIIGGYPLLTEVESMEALNASRRAFDNGKGRWPAMPAEERIKCFEVFLSGMKDKREDIAKILMWEIGKPYGDSLKEFDRTIVYIRDTIKVLKKQERAVFKLSCEQGIVGRMKKVPLGVALCMGPFNYPLYETFTAIAPALLTGNTVIFKPPRFGALLFGPLLRVFRDAFPEGVVNIVFGDGQQIIPPLMSSGMVDLFAFVGTSSVASSLKRLHPKQHRLRSVLGLEAKNPAIILPDADLDVAIKESVMGAFAFNGQRCAALKIFFVHRSIAEVFVKRFTEEASRLICGMPWEKNVFITPLVEPDKTSYLSGLIKDALKYDARIVNNGGGTAEGTFFHPTILYPVNPQMRIYHEEQFGPVVPIVSYDDIEEPLRYTVESNYGQQASIFGRDPDLMAHCINVLIHQVSRVNINCKCQRTPDIFPFTGRKDSAEGVLSVTDALNAFTTPAFVATRETEKDKKALLDISERCR